eukprot:jgi/Chrzof1/2950/Cz12g05170.t1
MVLASKCSAISVRVARPRISSRPVALNGAACASFAPRRNQCRALSARAAVVVKAMKVGDKLEDSSEYYRVLKSSDGQAVSLASYKGKQPVVLFFYPKAATPGCTKQVCKFRDEYEQFVKAGAAVFGISGDSPEDNKAFATAQRLPYPLLSDPSNIVRKTFGIKADLLGLLPGRQTYVFDINGKCVLCFNDQLNSEKHVEEALKAIKACTVNA